MLMPCDLAIMPPGFEHEFTRGAIHASAEHASSRFNVSSRSIYHLSVGETSYPLRRPLEGTLTPITGPSRQFELQISGMPGILGNGETPRDAENDFARNVHANLQRLVAMRPFERGPDDISMLRQLMSSIDIDRYLWSLPVRARQYGKLLSPRGKSWRVSWENGRDETVDVEQFPAEFAGYAPGQPFEAITLRDRRTANLIRAVDIARVPELRKPIASDSRTLWDSFRSSNELPPHPWGTSKSAAE